MRPVHVAALALLLALAAPAGAAARVGVTQHAINVTLLHEQTLKRQTPRAQADAQIVRDRARQCLDAFRAAPASAHKDLLGVYFNAVSGALWQTDHAGYAAWVERLAPAARTVSRQSVTLAPVALRRLLRAQGTRAARRALAAFQRGVDEPDARVIRAGDPVFAALSDY